MRNEHRHFARQYRAVIYCFSGRSLMVLARKTKLVQLVVIAARQKAAADIRR